VLAYCRQKSGKRRNRAITHIACYATTFQDSPTPQPPASTTD